MSESKRKQSLSSTTSQPPVSPTLSGFNCDDEELEKVAEDLLLDPGRFHAYIIF